LIYWDSKVSEADMDAMWKHPDVYKEWTKSGERRGNVRFSHDAKKRPYLSRVEVKVNLVINICNNFCISVLKSSITCVFVQGIIKKLTSTATFAYTANSEALRFIKYR